VGNRTRIAHSSEPIKQPLHACSLHSTNLLREQPYSPTPATQPSFTHSSNKQSCSTSRRDPRKLANAVFELTWRRVVVSIARSDDCPEVFHDIAELPVANDGIVPQNRPRPLPSTFF
jgi:hypothetical protein